MPRPAYKVLGLLSVLALVGCAEPAAYAPRAPGQSVGYTDVQLAQNRYRAKRWKIICCCVRPK